MVEEKVAFLAEIMRGEGDLNLSANARAGFYFILQDINDSLAADRAAREIQIQKGGSKRG